MSSNGLCPNNVCQIFYVQSWFMSKKYMSSGSLCSNNICSVVRWIQLSLYMFINEALVNPYLLNNETILK